MNTEQSILDQMKAVHAALGEAIERRERVDIPIMELYRLLELAQATGLE